MTSELLNIYLEAKLGAGVYVLQVGKRKFAKVTLG